VGKSWRRCAGSDTNDQCPPRSLILTIDRSPSSLLRRLSRAGFKGDFARSAILPEWWNDECEKDPSLLPELEVRIARFLGASVTDVRDVQSPLRSPVYPQAQLRRIRDLERDRLAPAIHAALRIASAVVRSLKSTYPYTPIPSSGLEWRSTIAGESQAVSFDALVGDLWQRGVPIVPLDVLPAPNFQGLACVVSGRPVIILGHKNDEPGRVAFLLAHEAGHIANGDCTQESPVVDEEEAVVDDADIETRADGFARAVLVGSNDFPPIEGQGFKELALKAIALEKAHGVDASYAIFGWAQRTRDYGRATQAVKAIYRHIGARRKLRHYFDLHVDTGNASDSDRALLSCVFGNQEFNETAH
jgi:hypothetical protein